MNLSQTIATRSLESQGGSRVTVNTAFSDLLAEHGLTSFQAIMEFTGAEEIKRLPDRSVVRFSLGEKTFFLKRHFKEKISLADRLCRSNTPSSEGSLEFNHYCDFRAKGLATATPVAMGERIIDKGHVQSFLITEDFHPLVSLEDIIRHTPELLAGEENRGRRLNILRAAALYAAWMHQAGFNHLDFNATHLLLHELDAQEPLVAVFDLQRVATNPLSRWRWPIKTLAELNFTMVGSLFTDQDRLFLFQTYVGRKELGQMDTMLWSAIKGKTEKIRRHTAKRHARKRKQFAIKENLNGPLYIRIRNQANNHLEPVTCTTLLRRVPGRRQVWEGVWHGEPVIIKSFFDKWRAQIHMDREWHGLQELEDRGVSAPQALFQGTDNQDRQVLVTAKIQGARPFGDMLKGTHNQGKQEDLLRALVRELAAQHRAGVLQQDLHLNNFLIRAGRIFSLDPAEMKFFKEPIAKAQAMDQLARLGAQLMAFEPQLFKRLCHFYADRRHWQFTANDFTALRQKRAEHFQHSLKRTLKKYLRENTRHRRTSGKNYVMLAEREADLKIEPDDLAKLLKRSTGSVTVLGKEVSVHTFKNTQGVLSFLQKKEAQSFWHRLYTLQIMGTPGETPLALLEPKKCWKSLPSYVISVPSSE